MTTGGSFCCRATQSRRIRGRNPERRIVTRPKPAEGDIHRSRMLAAVRSKGNRSTEARMRMLIRATRLHGWRRHLPLPGRPDFAWPGKNVALFVDGCFWHGCPDCYIAPRNNADFWSKKVVENRRRDRRVASQLRRQGWSVVRVWECKIDRPGTLARLRRHLDA